MVMTSRRELPTGMESYRAVYGNRTRITGLEDRGADHCVNTAKRNPRTRFTLIFFFSGFLSGHLGPRTRTSTHRGWRAVHLHQCPRMAARHDRMPMRFA